MTTGWHGGCRLAQAGVCAAERLVVLGQ